MKDVREGVVVVAMSRSFTVDLGDRRLPVAVPKRLRYLNPDLVDPVAVGDRVTVELRGEQAVVHAIHPRRGALARTVLGRAGKRQLLAANLDQAVVVMAAREPPYKPSTIDRYLVLASAAGLGTVVCINKVDLDPDVRRAADLEVYRDLGLDPVFVSARTGAGIEVLENALAGRTSVLVGPSGGGKSSLVNALLPEANLRTGEISRSTGKGTHTTTWVEMHRLRCGGRLVDSPGLRVLDLSGLSPGALAGHFPEFSGLVAGCRFGDCRHRSEPGCGVKAAVESGEVAAARYRSYLRIYESLERGEG